MSTDSLYSFNPYMVGQNTGFNNDFMANATAPINNQYAQQALMQQLALQQPTGDTFQKSEGGSGLNTGLQFAAVGGVGAGAGAYFFGDKLGAALTTDGKTFSDDILKAFQTDLEEVTATKYAKAVSKQKEQILSKYGFKDIEAFEKAAGNTSITGPEAQNVLKAQQEMKNIDIENLMKKALKEAQDGNLAYQMENVTNLANRKTLLEGLAKDATPAQIEELITKNPSAFGITKTAEAEIAQEAKKIAQQLGTDKTSAVKTITNEIKNVETKIGGLRETLNGKVAAHWDDTAKAFRESAPSSLKNAAKNFKWAKAGKYAAIAAGVGLVLGWMFGGSKA